MPNDEPNPYAPPAVDDDADARVATRPNDFASERRPVVLCLLLMIVTLGVYSGIWLARRRRFLDGLRADAKMGSLPIAVIGLYVAVFVFGFVEGLAESPKQLAPFEHALSTGLAVVTLIANFRAAAILRSELARSGRLLSVSGAATFFFGILYLQYKINEGADVAPRERKKTPKKELTNVAEDSAG